MGLRRLVVAVLAVLLLAATAMPAGAASRPTEARFGHVKLTAKEKARAERHVRRYLAHRDDPVQVVVELRGRPVAAYAGAALAAGDDLASARRIDLRASLRREQSAVRGAIAAAGGRIHASFTDVVNGLRVSVKPSRIGRLERIPGVKAVHIIPRATPALANAIRYTGAGQVWGRTGDTGQGVRIAIIDSGINYYHRDFDGAGYAAWQADDGLAAGGDFPTAKVAKGYDFVGDDYNGDNEPQPDDDPLDCKDPDSEVGQHGTHVAGIAAGVGVTTADDAYAGPYSQAAIDAADLRIAPGLAPEATLFAYRIFGCSGSTSLTVDAIEQAVRDGADVINMSLGSPLGNPDSIDAIAADNAVLAGVVVVASAGNEGPSAFVAGSPAAARRAISVAAMDAVPGSPLATIDMATGAAITGINANHAALPVSGALNVFEDDPNTTGDEETGAGFEQLGCDQAAWDYNGFQAGEIAVTTRGGCARTDRAELGQENDAAAVILVNNAGGLPPDEITIPGVDIPFIGVPADSATRFADDDGETVTIADGGVLDNPGYRHVAYFSSGGPSRQTEGVKPDIAAPGVSVLSAWGATTAQGIAYGGTSMAAPVVAGIAALVVQAHPGWRPAAIKGAIVGTASRGRVKPFEVRRTAAGAVMAPSAAATQAYVTTSPGSASLTFGYRPARSQRGSVASSLVRSFRIVNDAAFPITYRLSNTFDGPSLGSRLTLGASSVTVPAGGSRTIRARWSITESAAADLPSGAPGHGASLDESPDGTIYQVLPNAAGVITATPTTSRTGAVTLSIPWIAVPRGISGIQPDFTSRRPWSVGGPRMQTAIDVDNHGVHAGFADLYAWNLADDRDGITASDLRAGGVQSLPAEVCYGEEDPDDRCVVFAVSTWGRWDSAAAEEFDVNIDLTGDGQPEYLIFSYPAGAIFWPDNGIDWGVTATFIYDIVGDQLIDFAWAGQSPNGSTILIPALASEIGLDPSGQTSFEWTVSSLALADAYTADVVDVMGTGDGNSVEAAWYDAFDPVVSNGAFRKLKPGAGTTIGMTLDMGRYADHQDSNKGWMIVSLDDNAGPAQADLVPLGDITAVPG